MDGRNGRYRYNYHGVDDKGYMPYENDTHVYLGFWVFLNEKKIVNFYKKFYQVNIHDPKFKVFNTNLQIINNM
jgi:hypothetical protein